jgi:hypothetical protein
LLSPGLRFPVVACQRALDPEPRPHAVEDRVR